MRYYASLKATAVSSYNCLGYWGHFHILENLSPGVERVFSTIWGEWLSGPCHCRRSSLGTQLVIDTQPFEVTFGPKVDRPTIVINIR